MPRRSRVKSADAMYHVMSRSISERDLFQCDGDKDYYLRLLKRYKEQYKCSIYAYCLMDNHVHLFINPNGFDISKFMLCLNSAYVSYFNARYGRHGILFQGRFASRIVRDTTYALTLMAYIHNNAADLANHNGNVESYKFSSYGIYTGYSKDERGIVDTGFLLKIFSGNISDARRKCREFTGSMRGTNIMSEVDENIIHEYTDNEYKDDRKVLMREEKPDSMVRKISGIIGKKAIINLRAKHIREASGIRAFLTYVLRVLCGFSYKLICEFIGNMSLSGISRLFKVGFRLINSSGYYRNAFNLLMTQI
jgi:Transposase and inactivated derivatives